MDNDFLLLLQAKLEEASLKGIKGNLDQLKKEFEELKINPVLDQQALSNLSVKINKLFTDNKITISNIGIDATSGVKVGQEYGKQISQGISQGMKDNTSVLNSFKKSLENIGMGSKEIDAVANRIHVLVDSIESLNQSTSHSVGKHGSKDILSVDISGVDKLGQAIKLTEQYDMTNGKLIKSIDAVSTVQQKAGSATDAFIEKQQKAVATAKNTLSSIESKLNDPNITKSLAGTDFNTNGLTEKLERAKNAVTILGNANKNTFTQAQIGVNKEITELNNLISTLKNAEYAATSLRTKGISTIKIDEGNKLETFVQKMEQSGHYTDELKNKVSQLKTDLSNVFDSSSLTNYLNGVSNLQSEFQKVDAIAKTTEKSTKLQANIEAEKKILQVYTNELKEAGVLTGDVKTKIQEMFRSLSNINSQNGLTTWRAELKGVKAETDAVLKSTIQEKLEKEKLANIMADIREKTELARQTEEQRQQTAQSNAINKSLEQEYLQRQKISEQLSSKANKIQLSIETGEYESKVESLTAKTQQWTDVNGNARISTTNLSTALTELTTASEAYANNPTESAQKRLIESSEKLDAEYKKITNSVRTMNATMAKDSSIASLHNKVADFMSKNGKAVKYSSEFKRIFSETSQGAELTKQKVAQLNQEFNKAVVSARNAGKLGSTFFQTLREGMSSFSYWTSSTFLVMKAIQSVKNGISSVKALDTALVDLKKTTTMTNSELEDFYYESNKVAKQMGVTTEEIINQASAWSRLGFSSNEAATKMAQLSSKFSSISPGMSTDEAQEGLVSIIKAWGLDVDEVEREVMDNINTLGKFIAQTYSNVWDCVYVI